MSGISIVKTSVRNATRLKIAIADVRKDLGNSILIVVGLLPLLLAHVAAQVSVRFAFLLLQRVEIRIDVVRCPIVEDCPGIQNR